MKKYLIFVLVGIIIIAAILFISFKKDNNKSKTIEVAEVTHSIFYTPFYVALENGYFEEYGLDVQILLVTGSDNVAASVISGDTEIGLAGPESAIFVYEAKEKDYLQMFSGLTKRDGQFILSRNKDFKWEDLEGKEILVGRSTGMPAMSFFKALENNNISKDNVNINTSVDFAELAGTFIGGSGDYVNLFEPLASSLEKEGMGYVVESVGLNSNEFPYTAFYAKKSYIKENEDTIKYFTKAIEKGMKYTLNNDSKRVAKVIHKQFSDTNIKDLTVMIERYKKADVWLNKTKIEETFFNNLTTLLKENNLIKNNIKYKDLVINLND